MYTICTSAAARGHLHSSVVYFNLRSFYSVEISYQFIWSFISPVTIMLRRLIRSSTIIILARYYYNDIAMLSWDLLYHDPWYSSGQRSAGGFPVNNPLCNNALFPGPIVFSGHVAMCVDAPPVSGCVLWLVSQLCSQ